MRLLKLTRPKGNGDIIWVNPAKIQYITTRRDQPNAPAGYRKGGTIVRYGSGDDDYSVVKETPEEIDKLLEELE